MTPDETLLALIRQRDPDAAAGFFDAHAPHVRRYCEELVATGRLDEATLAAFVDVLGRVQNAPPGAELEDLLKKATRDAAASRAEVADARGPECHAMPDLLAGRINDELERDPRLLDQHRARCRVCQRTEERFAVAEEGWTKPAASEPAAEVRVAWLELMAERSPEHEPQTPAVDPGPAAMPQTPAIDPGPAAMPQTPATDPGAEAAQTPAVGPGTVAAQPIRITRRRGGLVGAARRFALGRRDGGRG